MSTQGFGREAASTLGCAASRFQRFITQISIHTCFKAATTSLLFNRAGGMRATPSLTVSLLDVSKFYEINARLTICQLMWTTLGFSPNPQVHLLLIFLFNDEHFSGLWPQSG
jgi:hypothetical protein